MYGGGEWVGAVSDKTDRHRFTVGCLCFLIDLEKNWQSEPMTKMVGIYTESFGLFDALPVM